MALLLAVCLLLAAALSMEREAGMLPVTRSTARGRGRFLGAQYATAVIEILILYGVRAGFELHALRQANLSFLSAPVQSIAWLSGFPIQCSVRGFLILHYLYCFVMLVCLGCLMLWLSGFFRGIRTARTAEKTGLRLETGLSIVFTVRSARSARLSS